MADNGSPKAGVAGAGEIFTDEQVNALAAQPEQHNTGDLFTDDQINALAGTGAPKMLPANSINPAATLSYNPAESASVLKTEAGWNLGETPATIGSQTAEDRQLISNQDELLRGAGPGRDVELNFPNGQTGTVHLAPGEATIGSASGYIRASRPGDQNYVGETTATIGANTKPDPGTWHAWTESFVNWISRDSARGGIAERLEDLPRQALQAIVVPPVQIAQSLGQMLESESQKVKAGQETSLQGIQNVAKGAVNFFGQGTAGMFAPDPDHPMNTIMAALLVADLGARVGKMAGGEATIPDMLEGGRKAVAEAAGPDGEALLNDAVNAGPEAVAPQEATQSAISENTAGGVDASQKSQQTPFENIQGQIESGQFNLYRMESEGQALDYSKPQGAYFSIEYPGFESPHSDLGGPETRLQYKPENPLVLPASEGMFDNLSTGMQALRHFVGEDEFNRLVEEGGVNSIRGNELTDPLDHTSRGTRAGKAKLSEMLSEEYPEVDWVRYHDSYEMLETVGAIKAREAGFDAIVAPSKAAPEFSEVVVLREPRTAESNGSVSDEMVGAGANEEGTSAQGGFVDPDLMTLGVKPFIEQDVIPTAKSALGTLVESARDIWKAISPGSVSDIAKGTAQTMRGALAEMARKFDVAKVGLQDAAGFFKLHEADFSALVREGRVLYDQGPPTPQSLMDWQTRLKANPIMDFLDRYERQVPQATPEMDAFAKAMREGWDSRVDEIQGLGTGKLQNVIEGYFKHLWKDPDRAESFYQGWFSKKPLEGKKGFLKSRSIPTIWDGITQRGLEPLYDNPVDTVLASYREMDKYIMAHRVVNWLEQAGIGKYVEVFKDHPEGWVKINDAIGTKWAGTKVTVSDVLDNMAKGTKYALWKEDFAKKIFSDQAARDELPAQMYGVKKSTGKSYSEQIMRGFLSDPETFRQKYPTVYQYMLDAAQNHPNLQEVLQMPTFDNESLKLPVGGLIKTHDFYAAPDAARVINNYLSPGLRGNAAFRAYLSTSNILNQAQLGFSAFHMGFTVVNAMVQQMAAAIGQASHGDFGEALKSTATVPVAPLKYLLDGRELFKEWMVPGSQGAEVADMIDRLMEAGGRAKMDDFYRTTFTDSMMSALRQFNVIGAAVRLPFALAEKTMVPLMEYAIPRIKMAAFSEMARYELERLNNLGASDAVIKNAMTKIWDSVDNRFGQLVYDNLFWDKSLKDISMASMRSLGWNLGSWREGFGAIKDTGEQAYGVAKGRTPGMTYRMQYAVALPLVVGLMGAVTQYLFTGKGPYEMKDLFFPRTGQLDEAGRAARVSLPSYMKDAYHLSTNPTQAVLNKLNPMLETVAELLENRNFYGVEIRSANDPVMRQIADVGKFLGTMVTPFAVQGAIRQHQIGGSGISQALSFLGVTSAPADISKTPAERLAGSILGEHGDKAPITKEQERTFQVQRDIRRYARLHQPLPPDVTAEKMELTKRQLKNAQGVGNMTPLQSQFKRVLSLPDGLRDGLRILQRATPQERQDLQRIWGARSGSALKNAAPANLPQVRAQLREGWDILRNGR
jgi:hypothetical protein